MQARTGRIAVAFIVVSGSALMAIAQEALVWEVTGGTAKVVCPLTVGGSFEARSTAISGRVTAQAGHQEQLDGAIAVDLRTLDTGIGFRNDHMREKYLEVDKGDGFDHAELSAIRLEGIDPATGLGKGRFNGTFAVHGETRRILGDAEIRRDGEGVHVEASFPLAMADFGIPKTEYLGVGVKNEIRVKIALDARRAKEPKQASLAAPE